MTGKRLKKEKSVSVVIPTMNDADYAKVTVGTVDKILRKEKAVGKYEIILIDDSNEIENKKLKKYCGKIARIISRGRRMGMGSAVLRGIKESKNDVVVIMECDMSCHPKYIPGFLRKINEGYDMVIGSRYVKGSKFKKYAFKKMVSSIGNKLTKFMLGTNLNDHTIIFRAFLKNKISLPKECSNKEVFLAQFLIESLKNGCGVAEIPVSYIERKTSYSKIYLMEECLEYFDWLFKTFVERIIPI